MQSIKLQQQGHIHDRAGQQHYVTAPTCICPLEQDNNTTSPLQHVSVPYTFLKNW